MKSLVSIVTLIAMTAAASAANGSAPLSARIEASTNSVTMGADLPIAISIQNTGDTLAVIDCSPDEVIAKATDKHGEVKRERGSRYTVTISQDTQYRGFITISRKLAPRAGSTITVQPEEKYSESLTIPTDSDVYLQSGPLIPGPAIISATLHLIVGTNRHEIACNSTKIVLIQKNEDAQPAGGAYVSPAAGDPSAHP